MMKKIKESSTCRLIGFMIVSALVICCMWKIYYGTVDEVFYRNIISGKYTGSIRPSGTMIKYPLALVIALVSRIFSTVDVFGVFLMASHFVCFFLAGKYVLRVFPGHRKSALLMFGIVFWMTGVPNIIYLQFTTTAAVYAATGVFLLLLEEDGLKGHLPSICMFTMSVCVRKETFIMTVPFILLVWLLRLWDGYRFRQDRARGIRQCTVYLLTAAVLYGGIIGLDDLAGDRDAVHQEYKTHRANVRDYDGVPDYDLYPEFYQSFGENGLSRAEYTLITKQMVIFDFSTDIHDIFRDMHAFNLANRTTLGIKYKLAEAVSLFLTIWRRVLVKPQIVITGLTGIIVIAWLMIDRKKIYALFALTGGAGIGFESFILFYRGRMPERVMQSLMFLGVMFLCGMLVRALSQHPAEDTGHRGDAPCRQCFGHGDKVCYILMAVSYITVFLTLLLPGINEKQDEYEKRYRKNTIVNEYCAAHPDNVYFTTGSIGDTDRLGSKYNNSFVNYISPMLNLGPSYRELLKTAGIEGTAEEAITAQENVYLLGKEGNAEFVALDEYFAEKYMDAYSCEIVDRMEDSYCVWKVKVRTNG